MFAGCLSSAVKYSPAVPPADDRRTRGIEALEYDEPTKSLLVRFRSGRSYRYADIPAEVYHWLARVPSKTAVFNRLIRDHYSYTDVTEPQATVDLSARLRASLAQNREPGGTEPE